MCCGAVALCILICGLVVNKPINKSNTTIVVVVVVEVVVPLVVPVVVVFLVDAVDNPQNSDTSCCLIFLLRLLILVASRGETLINGRGQRRITAAPSSSS